MEKKNNFQLLEDQEFENLDFNSDGIKSGIDSSVGIFRSISDVVELYLPKVFETIIELFKPETKNQK